MAYTTSTLFEYRLYNVDTAAIGDQPYILEVQFQFFSRVIYGLTNQILRESEVTARNDAVLRYSFRQLHDPKFCFFVKQYLSELHVPAAPCEVIAQKFTSLITQMAAKNRDTNFHIFIEIDFIRVAKMEPIPGVLELTAHGRRNIGSDGALLVGTLALEEDPSDIKRSELETKKFIVMKLTDNREEEEDLGDCSICLDELNCKMNNVIKISCGHVYHLSCIVTSLNINGNYTCPLCRAPLPLLKE